MAWEDQREHDYGWGIFGAFLDYPGPIKLPLSPARYTSSPGAVRGSWRLQIQLASAFARRVQRNVDESRGAAVDSYFFPSPLRSIVFRFSRFGVGIFLIGLFLTFSAFWGRGFGVFLPVSSFPPPRSVPWLVWVIGPPYCGTGHVF